MGYNKYELERDNGFRFMAWLEMSNEQAIEKESYLLGGGGGEEGEGKGY